MTRIFCNDCVYYIRNPNAWTNHYEKVCTFDPLISESYTFEEKRIHTLYRKASKKNRRNNCKNYINKEN